MLVILNHPLPQIPSTAIIAQLPMHLTHIWLLKTPVQSTPILRMGHTSTHKKFTHQVRNALLSAYCQIPASQLTYTLDSAGKPTLLLPSAKQPIHFNTSYCDDMVVIGVSRQPLGIDIESVDRARFADKMMSRWLPPILEPSYNKLSQPQKIQCWANCWTAWEACCKRQSGILWRQFGKMDPSIFSHLLAHPYSPPPTLDLFDYQLYWRCVSENTRLCLAHQSIGVLFKPLLT